MMQINRKQFKCIFNVICTIVVVSMISYWYYKYAFEDRDIGVVDYVSLEKSKDIEFPLATLCFQNPFVEERLKRNDSGINSTSYLKYLKGESQDGMFKSIDYQNVTLQLDDYFLSAKGYAWNDSDFKEINNSFSHTETFNGILGKTFTKCFSLKHELGNNHNIKMIALYYDLQKLITDWTNSISKLSFGLSKLLIGFTFNYPGQFFLADIGHMSYNYLKRWSLYRELFIDELEILERRNSRNKQCSENPPSYDKVILEKLMSSKGCTPPYLDKMDGIPVCSTVTEKIKSELVYEEAKLVDYPKACKRISKMRITKNFKSSQIAVPTKQYLVMIRYPDEVRVITQSKEVDLHSLIGNIGGYLGLFLGNFFYVYVLLRRLYNHPPFRIDYNNHQYDF